MPDRRCKAVVRYGHGVPAKYVSVDSVATLVHHRGRTTLPGHPPDTSAGVTVLCLHDAGGNGNDFAGVLDALAEAGQSPVAYDQPGHGRSGALDSLGDVTAMLRHARGLATTIGLDRPVLVGEGLGAAVALEAAIADPSWPAALVLCGGATTRFAIGDDVITQIRRIAGGKARREFDQTGYAPTTGREVYQKAFGEWIKTDPRTMVGDREAQRAWDATDRVGAVTCPVVVVVGEHEDASSRAAAEQLAGAVANGRVVTLAGAGRHGVYEQPAALADAIGEVAR